MAESRYNSPQPLTTASGTAETMTEAILPENLVLSLLQSQEEFPVDFDTAWQWIGYAKKQNAKDKLTHHFERGLDYLPKRVSVPSSNASGFTHREEIRLTVDCFKSLAMMAGTSRGREVRKYFLNCERQLKGLLLEPQIEPRTKSDWKLFGSNLFHCDGDARRNDDQWQTRRVRRHLNGKPAILPSLQCL